MVMVMVRVLQVMPWWMVPLVTLTVRVLRVVRYIRLVRAILPSDDRGCPQRSRNQERQMTSVRHEGLPRSRLPVESTVPLIPTPWSWVAASAAQGEEEGALSVTA